MRAEGRAVRRGREVASTSCRRAVGEREPAVPLADDGDNFDESALQVLGRRLYRPSLAGPVQPMPEQAVARLGRPEVVSHVIAPLKRFSDAVEPCCKAVPRLIVGRRRLSKSGNNLSCTEFGEIRLRLAPQRLQESDESVLEQSAHRDSPADCAPHCLGMGAKESHRYSEVVGGLRTERRQRLIFFRGDARRRTAQSVEVVAGFGLVCPCRDLPAADRHVAHRLVRPAADVERIVRTGLGEVFIHALSVTGRSSPAESSAMNPPCWLAPRLRFHVADQFGEFKSQGTRDRLNGEDPRLDDCATFDRSDRAVRDRSGLGESLLGKPLPGPSRSDACGKCLRCVPMGAVSSAHSSRHDARIAL